MLLNLPAAAWRGDQVKATSEPLKGHEEQIKRIIRRKSLAMRRMILCDCKVKTALGLNLE